MHILATDHLTCPRCGPAFGLILMSDVLVDRRVVEGSLGCPNCRESYPIREGISDLRHPSATPLQPADLDGAEGEVGVETDRGFRFAALLGITTPNAALLVLERNGELAPRIAEVLEAAHVIGISAVAATQHASGGVLSPLLAGVPIPIRSHSVRGVAIADLEVLSLLDEAARVLMPGARLVVDPAPAEAPPELRKRGFQLRLEQDGVVVADAPGPR